jgi:hypothetical protein
LAPPYSLADSLKTILRKGKALELRLAPGRNLNSDKGEIEVEVVDDEVGLAVEVACIEVEVEGVAAR